MKIPKNLRRERKDALICWVREMQKAITAERLRCMGRKRVGELEDCGGLHLEEGNCPLYEFRPWGSSPNFHSPR